MNDYYKRVIIIGSGPAGLTAVYQKNANLANLLANVLIAVVNLKRTDVVAGTRRSLKNKY